MLLFVVLFLIINFGSIFSINPVLDVDKDLGYHGKINEKNVLVDLVPHLQIKNIEQINGICSYHVYKPNNEDFPFIIDIKDKYSGEAVIQLGQKENSNEFNEIDCKKRKFYKFFIEAHDCSEPVSFASEKIPVTIEIIDHNDHKLKFDGNNYASLIEDTIDDAIVIVKARDDDCTNDGYACNYEIIKTDEKEDIPFTINKLGFISNTRKLKKSNHLARYDVIVRAYDCLDNNSYVDTNVYIDLKEPCKPQWTSESVLINATTVETQIFNNNFKMDLCNDEFVCTLDGYSATIELDMNNFSNGCEIEKCGEVYNKFEFLENTDSDETKEPIAFETFKRVNEKSIKINFDGNFGNKFELKAWIRRSRDLLNTNEKEHVFCGSDSELLNRHHYGLYFYRKNIKFLLRREKQQLIDNKNDEFYPSLWEWTIDNIDGDSKWHFYEIKYDYPIVSLYIDGIKYEENQTNSDIIDAHELDNISGTGLKVTYVGACYNARSHTYSNFFNGDIAGLNLYKEQTNLHDDYKISNRIECVKNCQEYLDLNMIGNENYLKSIDLIKNNLIKINTKTYVDLITLLQKINYVNKHLDVSQIIAKSQIGKRFIKLKSDIICLKNPYNNTDNSKININVKDIVIDIDVNKPRQELNVQIDGNKQYVVSKNVLVNKGFDLLKGVTISKKTINQVNPSVESSNLQNNDIDDSVSDENDDYNDDSVYFTSCSIKIVPSNVNEKIMFAPLSDDDDAEDDILGINDEFKLTRNNDIFKIDGLNTIESYQNYFKGLVYLINDDENNKNDVIDELNANKLFYLSCIRNEPAIETNTILIQVNITNEKEYVAYKKMNKFTADDNIIEKKVLNSNPSNSNTIKASSPAIVIIIVLCSGLLAFLLVFTAIRMKTSRDRRRGGNYQLNEENPQMEWDDSGLNITENPLEVLDANVANKRKEYDDYSSTDDSENEYYYNDTEDEPEKIVDKELEWDDTTLEINENKIKRARSNLEHARRLTNA